MGLLSAKATGGLIRASVAVVSTGDVAHAKGVNTLKAKVQFVVASADVSYIRFVLDVLVDSIGYNRFVSDVSVVADVAVLGVSKPLHDNLAVGDAIDTKAFNKGRTDALHTAETKSFTFSKALADYLTATDDFMGLANVDDDETMVFSKALPNEQLGALDNTTKGSGKRVTDTAHPTDVRTAAVGKGLTENLGTTEVRTTSLQKSIADAVDAGDEFNAVALTDDGEVMVFGKRLADEFTQSDFTSVQAEKGIADDNVTSDQIDYIEVGKGLEDVPVTSEVLGFDTGKALADSAVPTDFAAFGFGRGVNDRVSYGDGPNAYDTYAYGYFAETYALEGFPALSFNKGIFDTVHTTDDFFGVANTDDDETMQFGKTLGDLAHPVDAAKVTYSKALADLVAKSDLLTTAVGKSLVDQVSKADLAVKGTDKVFSDTKTTSDAATRGIGKGLSDNPVTAEYNYFAIQKKLSDVVITTDDFLGNANADDDETMLFGKTISDSFTKSDSTIKTAGKGLAETASTSESGSIVWTDYWPIGYTDTTSGVYVGTRRTF